jgi:hypothetical protein
MNTKRDEMSRITIDIPVADHKRLKAIAAVLGKSMRDVVIDSIESHLHKIKVPGKSRKADSTKKPNKKTLEAIANIEKGKNLVEAQSAEDLFKKLGI